MLFARRRIENRVEIDERIVLRCVLVDWCGDLSEVGSTNRWMAASRRLACRVIAHVLHEAAPRQTLRLELVGDGSDVCGIHASIADGLPIARDSGLDEIVEVGTIDLRLGSRRDAGNHCEIVAEAVVRDAVVLTEECASPA